LKEYSELWSYSLGHILITPYHFQVQAKLKKIEVSRAQPSTTAEAIADDELNGNVNKTK
jgi:hypothetical protein